MTTKTASPAKARISREERQIRIIASAAALFAKNGFKGTTTREIAKAAAISEALLFKYFPTKRALYSAILAEKAPIAELLAAVEDAANKRDDRRVFQLIASYRIRRATDPTMLRLLLFSALEGHELSAMFFKNQHRMFYEYLSGYIDVRIREGAFRGMDPLLAAHSFIGMVVHHRLLHEIFGVATHCTPEESVETYVSLFLEGMQTAPRRSLPKRSAGR
jgi:AcrR family transcriptional regulator